MIEQFNRTLEEVLSKLEEIYDWDKFVKPILMSYNTSRQKSTCLTSYYLMFRKDLKLPIKEVILFKTTILKWVIKLIHKILIFRENAKTTINRV